MENIVHLPHPEALLTGDATGQMFNLCAWDPATGAALTTFKGSATAAGTLSLLDDSFLVSAQPAKPLLNVWQVNRHEQVPSKVTTPGKVTALAATEPGGRFIVGAVGEKLYVWQTCTGALLRVLSGCGHYQDVTRIAFTDDGSHFVSAGKDGNVLVWSTLEVVSRARLPGQPADRADLPLPRHAIGDHKMPVTDLHITEGGVKARLFTCSLDQTCKVYGVADGRLLLDISFAVPLTSVTVDAAQVSVYLGTSKGGIQSFSLLSPPRDLKATLDRDESNTFGDGHTDAVTCIAVSMDGLTVASGSTDGDVRLWHASSKQCVRTIGHKGPVTAVKFLSPAPRAMFEQKEAFRPGLVMANQLQKTLTDRVDEVEVVTRERIATVDGESSLGKRSHADTVKRSASNSNATDSEEVKKLKAANLELYQFAVKNIMTGTE